MHRLVGIAARLITASSMVVGGACANEMADREGTTAAAPRRQAPPIEGGCPEAPPILTVDMNRDGTVDVQVVPEDGGTCRAVDLNFDGVFDLFRHRDAAGRLLREEADGDFDRRLDSVALYRPGAAHPYREEFDANWDGRLDLWIDLGQDCAFLRAPGGACTTRCAVDWCRPRGGAPAQSESPEAAAPGPPPSVAVLYRDANGDSLWDTAQVLLDRHPICTAFNTGISGETPDSVRPETVEVYTPGGATIDYLRRDYLDLRGDPIVRCENADGAVIDCPRPCAP